ncbi:MAG: DUF2325 domain-containing protein [Desulfobacterales bacterium]
MQNSFDTRSCNPLPMEAQQNSSLRGLKFWEINDFFTCPIAGLCLAVSEQKQLLKKAGISLKKKNLFEIHETLVASSKNDNPLSRKVDCLLARKFSREAKSLAALKEDELREKWHNAFESGEYAGTFWYLASRGDLSAEFRREIFGDIHMSMHKNSAEEAARNRRITLLLEQNRKAEEKTEAEKKKRKTLQKELESLRASEQELKARLAEADRQMQRYESELETLRNQKISDEMRELAEENRRWEAECASLSEKVKSFAREAVRLESKNKQLTAELSWQNEAKANFQKEVLALITQLGKMQRCDKSCPSFDLCRKRVLIVGGLSKMQSLYRELVESNGGIFEYHDGDVKGGVKNLENSFMRADIVLCPVNCNSHAACSLVKHMGKKHNKSVRMLSGSGLNAIFRGIQTSDAEICAQN